MRIAGITIPDDKNLGVALTSIYGIGRTKAIEILEEAGIDATKKAPELSEKEEAKVRDIVENHKVEGDLKREVSGNIKRLKDIESYKGKRHEKNMPLRGQRTRTNARTVPSGISAKTRKRVTMGSGRVKVEKK